MPAINENLGNGSGSDFGASSFKDVPPTLRASSGAILIADDNADDALHAKRIVEKLHLPNPVQVVFSGAEVLTYLEGQGSYASRDAYPYPSLLLLDLRMPSTDGFEVLKWLQAHPAHSHLPVVVLSVVRELPMISWAYQLGARSFLIKPLTLNELRRTLQALRILPAVDLTFG